MLAHPLLTLLQLPVTLGDGEDNDDDEELTNEVTDRRFFDLVDDDDNDDDERLTTKLLRRFMPSTSADNEPAFNERPLSPGVCRCSSFVYRVFVRIECDVYDAFGANHVQSYRKIRFIGCRWTN